MAKKLKLKYRRGNGGFRKGFAHFVNGAAINITTLPLVDTFIWWFKDLDGIQRQISWTGIGDVDGANSEQFYFDVPDDFFNKVTNYDCDVEAYDLDGTTIYHTEESFLVEVTEPAGVHSDT
jgi:hypothetical protein